MAEIGEREYEVLTENGTHLRDRDDHLVMDLPTAQEVAREHSERVDGFAFVVDNQGSDNDPHPVVIRYFSGRIE